MNLSVSPLNVLALLAFASLVGANAGDPYREEILKWRTEREDRLKAERGWLTVAGLFWLGEGENTIGSESSNKIVFPGSAPARLGTITFAKGVARLHLSEGVSATIDGKSIEGDAVLKSDASGSPDKVAIGPLTFTVIQRGKRTGIRLYDQNAETRRDFKGCKWFPIDSKYHVRALYTPYLPPKTIPITNVLGDTSNETCIGQVSFVLNGHRCTLDALDEDTNLFFIIHDRTSGSATYGAGRFLYTPKPKDGYVDLDFNKAENPPCAFTSFATCPLPPKQNFLPIAVKAGEIKDGHHG